MLGLKDDPEKLGDSVKEINPQPIEGKTTDNNSKRCSEKQECNNQQYVIVSWCNQKRLRKPMPENPADECCIIS